VSASTTALNAVPKRLIARLEATIGAPTARDRVRQFYDAGVAFGVLGAAGALVGALWAWARAWLAVWHEAEAHARTTQSTVAHVVKRAFEAGAKAVPKVHGSSGGIQPLVRGRIC
jgi:hypothetical protein